MLYPRIQSVSSKGQIVLPAEARKAFKIGPRGLVEIFLNEEKEEITIRSLGSSDPIRAGRGVLAGGASLTKALLKDRRREKELEEKKYGSLRF